MTGAPRNTSKADAQLVLRARARVLARPVDSGAATAAVLEILEFRLARERYGVEIGQVLEVYPLKNLAPVPCTPAFIPGIVNVRGRIVPVLDLKKFFGLPGEGLTDLHRVILLQRQDLEVGLLADATEGVRSIPLESLQPSLPTLTGIRGEYLKGVTADRLVVLDVARLLADPGLVVHDNVEL